MTEEALMERKEDIEKIINLLATYGDHKMSDEELVQVSKAYKKYSRFLLKQVNTPLVVNNLLLALSSIDVVSTNLPEVIVKDLIFIVSTLMVDKYLLYHFIDERLELKEERAWIKKFKATKNREPDAAYMLMKKLDMYQNELNQIDKMLNEKGHQKVLK